ncbi:MAG: hypothetical protein QG622_3327, partial [Actinomycetota bacterium]|nr:hypothetical protein [Actinomycetota bacterium]
ADALRVDPGFLTGQPYPPSNASQALVTGVTHRIRRLVGRIALPPDAQSPVPLDEAEAAVARAVATAEDGDESALASTLPELLAGVATADSPPTERARRKDLGCQVLLLAAGLLRRLGHWDLAWTLTHEAEQRIGPGGGVLLEQARLLCACGHPDQALARVARGSGTAPGDRDPFDDVQPDQIRDAELASLVAVAQAITGHPGTAMRTVDSAERRAGSPAALAVLAATRVVLAVESGAVDKVHGLLDAVDQTTLAPADRASLLVTAAAAAARQDAIGDAVIHLTEADRLAPLRTGLDPFARDLLIVLPTHAHHADTSPALRFLADRAGLSPHDPGSR